MNYKEKEILSPDDWKHLCKIDYDVYNFGYKLWLVMTIIFIISIPIGFCSCGTPSGVMSIITAGLSSIICISRKLEMQSLEKELK